MQEHYLCIFVSWFLKYFNFQESYDCLTYEHI